MKRNLYLLGFMVLALASCDKVKDAIKNVTKISQDIDLQGQPYTLPTLPQDSTGNYFPKDTVLGNIAFPTNVHQFIIDNKVDTNAIDTVTVKKLTVTITNPANEKFDFINKLILSISAKGLPDQQQLVSATNIDPTANTLSFDVNSSTNLKPYLLKDTIYITVHANFIKAPQDGTVITVGGTMHMVANPLN
jgi:hypothetical protein